MCEKMIVYYLGTSVTLPLSIASCVHLHYECPFYILSIIFVTICTMFRRLARALHITRQCKKLELTSIDKSELASKRLI